MAERARRSSSRTSPTRIPRERSNSRSFMRSTSSAPYAWLARSGRPSSMSASARAASEHQKATCHIMSRTAHPSALTPGRSSRSAGMSSRTRSNAAHRSASPRSNSSRRPIGLPLRDELERHLADQHLVASPGAGGYELALDALLDEPSLEAFDLGGILEIGFGDPAFDAPTHDAEPFTLTSDGEAWPGGTDHDVRAALLDRPLCLGGERREPLPEPFHPL